MSDISSRFRTRPASDSPPAPSAPPRPRAAFSEAKPSFSEPKSEPSQPVFANPMPPPAPRRKKSSKKKRTILTFLVALILVGAGAAGAWFLLKTKTNPPAPQTESTQSESQASQQPIIQSLTPTAITYAYSESGGNQELFWRPISGGDRASATQLKNNSLITSYDIFGNQVIAVVTGAGDELWYSKDAGKTYSQIFSSSPAPNTNQLDDTITSVTFSTDGTSIIFAFLPSGSGQNTIKEINPETKQVTDLFAVESPGISLKGYIKNQGEILYYRGCYQCSQPATQLLKRSMSSSSDNVLYEEVSRISEQVVVDPTGKKVLILNSSRLGDTLGGEAPYYLTEVSIASAHAEDLLALSSVPAGSRPRAGYSQTDGSVYYSSGAGVYTISGDSSTKIFEATGFILEVYLVDDQQVVAAAGDHDDFSLTNYSIPSQESALILSGNANTTIIGVTYN